MRGSRTDGSPAHHEGPQGHGRGGGQYRIAPRGVRMRRRRRRRQAEGWLVLLRVGQGGGDDAKQASPTASQDQVLAEVKGENGITLTVTSAKRDQGGFVTVEGTVTNNTDNAWVAADWRGDERELSKNGASIAGASLIDQKGKKKYLILRDTSGRCLCTQFTGGVSQGATTQWFAQFPAPPPTPPPSTSRSAPCHPPPSRSPRADPWPSRPAPPRPRSRPSPC